jgi:ubiquitin carboxyl-terminal hydrolase 8
MYNILVIDVRNREEFDAGHINRPSVMCIEPTVLQDGCSASQLQDRLILSPDEEQAMFDRRDEYDLVVYYDEGTRTSAFLRQHTRTEKELALKRLYDSLVVFHDDKPLRRPPLFLMGGLDAWIEMLGAPGLKRSSTSTVVATKQTKPARSIRRVTGASHGDKFSIQKRRMREYIPMDPEEEQRWLEEARQGRVVFNQSGDVDGDDEIVGSPLYQSTEEFLRRFPEVEIEPQSMVLAPPRPPAPPQYAPPAVPLAPSRPAPSVSRVSYSGVHERQATPQGRSAQLPVYISPGRYGQIRLHRTGLTNFGVTCYMNSVVQCLCGNSDLANIFLSHQYEKDLQKSNWKGTKGILSESFSTLLSNLFKGDVPSCRPSTLRVCISVKRFQGIQRYCY